MKMLLFGKDGQVGFELQRSLAPLGEVIALNRQQLDLSDTTAITNSIYQHRPDWIVNAAAYTAVDKAEAETELAMQINALAPEVMANAAAKIGCGLLHYSTDYVFDGSKTSPWLETDIASPINVYGQTKWIGEEAIQASGCQHLIVRTSWVYDARGHNFLNTMLRLAKSKENLSIVDDQIGAPTWSRHIADASGHLLRMATPLNNGVYHLTASGQTSWFGFARAIFERAGAHGLKVPELVPIHTKDYPTPAARPANSLLNGQKLYQNFGLRLPDWQQSLSLVMQQKMHSE
ncbi:MAG TPA: dTDP-4-dehydrorhamnose reductase [Methylophaga sp.]|nr:dTDP-4-dehydrorhamnose reductase [Methylophaga sp.]